MNLVDGKILDARACDEALESLEERINETMLKPSAKQVIDACDRLVKAFDESFYLLAMNEFGIPEELGRRYMAEASLMFSGETLRYRMKKELGEEYDSAQTILQEGESGTITERILPLGVILHVAAGNVDGLPAFSVLEGLLTGNINILKLPAAEGGISVRILKELIKIEPALAEYIYVFDYSSKDIIHMNKLINAADAVALWGGTDAVASFRALLPPNIKLIEWGHKISFAYVTMGGVTDEALLGIALNIAATGQLLCSSCQGIFVDTDDLSDIHTFCERFLPILEGALSEHAGEPDIRRSAAALLERYSSELETIFTKNRIFSGESCSLIACSNQILEPSAGFANLWVKMLPKEQLIKTLRPYKNYLQTVSLVCSDDEKPMLENLLLKTGIVRICPGARMSETYKGMPHDGEYPLRRYTKTVSVE